MYADLDDALDDALGPAYNVWLWPGDDVMLANITIARGRHVRVVRIYEPWEAVPLARIVSDSAALAYPQLDIEHQWHDHHPQDVSGPCEAAVRLSGWRPMTDEELGKVEANRDGSFSRRRAQASRR